MRLSDATYDDAFVQVPTCDVALQLAEDTEPRAGQRVYALSPSGCAERDVREGTVTEKLAIEGNVGYFRTDLEPEPGSSGGPLITETGDVLGVLVAGNDEFQCTFGLPVSYLLGPLEYLRDMSTELDELHYCAECGFLGGPDDYIGCATWACCGNCGTVFGEIDREESE